MFLFHKIQTILKTFHVILLITLAFTIFNQCLAQVPNSLVLESVERNIDLTSQLARVNVKLVIKSKEPTNTVSKVQFLKNPLEKGTLVFIAAKDTQKNELSVQENPGSGDASWTIKLAKPLKPQEAATINVEYVLVKALEPYPSKISQRDRQLVKFLTTQNLYSAYPITEDKTTFKLSSKSVEQFTKVNPVSQSDSTIVYGPYKQVAAQSKNEILVHFENNTPFLVVKQLTRAIEVSHWGNIAVEENIDILHQGALLKGPFSRYEYQRDANSGLSSVKSYKTILPASAHDIYYRDMNGNISTSHTKIRRDSVELDLRPRFPLFGGWKTVYTLGYNVPSYEYLFNKDDEYLLKMRVIDHIFDNMVVEDVTVKVILPEGSTDIKLETPYPVERLPNVFHYTYLDFQGRPVISFRKRDLVENHIQEFHLRYKYPKVLMLQEPLLVFGALFALFLVIIVYVRLDFSLSKTKHA